MTETYTAPTTPEDIDDGVDTTAAGLDRQADALLREDETRTFGARPLRRAVREDAGAARVWGRGRVERLRDAVESDPVKASLYALGLGVVIGLLVAR